jgi:ferric-dicitrate binding protein FerR (iron transport regulator)
MNAEDLDVRLRRHFAGVDTSRDFEARVLERVAALPAATIVERRLRCERQQFELRERQRREAWLNAATALGIGAAALAVVWRKGPEVAGWVHDVFAAAGHDGGLGAVVAIVGGWFVWSSCRTGEQP